jgi:phage N-6-adenine-methyltransferase
MTKIKADKPPTKSKLREIEFQAKLDKLAKWEADLDVATSFPSGMEQIRENQEATQASLLHLRESIAMNRALLAPKGAKGPKGGGPQDVRTPPEFFKFIEHHLGIKFVIDLAATPENALCPAYYSLEDGVDSLQKDWSLGTSDEFWGWLNPPYGHVLPWVRKAKLECERGARIVMLLRASSGKWFADHIYGQNCHVMRMYGRMKFPGYGGDGSNFDTQVVSFDGKPYRDELWDWKRDMNIWQPGSCK